MNNPITILDYDDLKFYRSLIAFSLQLSAIDDQ